MIKAVNPFAQLMLSANLDDIADADLVDAKVAKELAISASYKASKFKGRPPNSFSKEGKLLAQGRPPPDPLVPPILSHLLTISPAYQEYLDETRSALLTEARNVANSAPDMSAKRAGAGAASGVSRRAKRVMALTPIVDQYKLVFKAAGKPIALEVAKWQIGRDFVDLSATERVNPVRNLAARLRRAKLAS